MIISRTPLRVSFLGGGSDLPAYYRRNRGVVISASIDKYVYVTVSKKFDDAVRVSYSRTEEVAGAAEVQHPLVREALQHLKIEGGVEITSIADIPSKGSGLGSSSSFTVGLLNALHGHSGRHVAADQLAEESCLIEIERCREPIGKQDQYAAAFGGFNSIHFNPDDSVSVRRIIWSREQVEALRGQLLMFYTGITRLASSILSAQSASMSQDEAKVRTVDRMVGSAESVLKDLLNGRTDSLGEALHESWELKKSLAAGVSNLEIDQAYEAARSAGAVGGKILGAGGGGFLLLFVPPEHQERVRTALRALREIPFRFSRQGSSIIFVH